MKVLVAGATGFIGRTLCLSLARAGHEVIALSRNSESARRRLPWLGSVHDWDPVAEPAPGAAVEGTDAIVNLVGESVAGVWTARKKRFIHDSRIKSTANLVAGLERAGARPKVLISASAVGYYGDRGEEKITESTPPGSGFLSDLCVRWEGEALRAQALGVRVVILRIGLVLGEAGGLLRSLLPAARIGLLGPLGPGAQWWPWVHIADVAGMARFALAHEIKGPVNVTAPDPVRQKDFARMLSRLLGRPSFMRVPSFLLDLAGGVAADSLKSIRAIPQAARQAGYSHLYADLVTALCDLTGRS